MLPNTLPYPPNYNLFDCISIEHEWRIKEQEVEIIGYFIATDFPRLDLQTNNPFPFVYGLFKEPAKAYGVNQDVIMSISNQMFSDSQPLTSFEEQVLNSTFERLLKTTPTRKNRI